MIHKFKIGLPLLSLNIIVINNGIKLNKKITLPDRPSVMINDIILLIRSWRDKHAVNHNDEAGVYISHLRVTQKNDKVLAIGLGNGGTLIPVTQLISPLGIYTCIEPSSSQIEMAKQNILLNNVEESKYQIIHGYAGNEIFDSPGEILTKKNDINLFEFDVLELDCEGCELAILSKLAKKPRNIIVELHPNYFSEEFKQLDDILNLLETKGYEYLFSYGHAGDFLRIEQAKVFYQSDTIKDKFKLIDNNGNVIFGAHPIVVTFSLKK